MKLHLFALSRVVLTTVALSSSMPASADTTIYRLRGNSAGVGYGQANGCGGSNLTIGVTENVSRVTGSETAEAVMVSVSGNIWDYCDGSPNYGTQVVYDGVSQPETIVSFTSTALRSAVLKVTVPVRVFGPDVHDGSVIIDLSWVGTNTYLNTGFSSSRQMTPNGLHILRQTGVYRSAAVTGTVLFDGVSVTNGTYDAVLSRTTEGTLTVIH